MHQEAGSQIIELTREITDWDGVRFDPEAIILEGLYLDELSTYRARKVWAQTFKSCFLLELDHDISFTVRRDNTSARFTLACSFKTACARYAFWRLTNHQAPEAQYQIETAHIPQCESREADFLRAPDMKPKFSDDTNPLVDAGFPTLIRVEHRSVAQLVRTVVKSLTRNLIR